MTEATISTLPASLRSAFLAIVCAVVLALPGSLASAPAARAQQAHEPARGTAERSEVLDSIRPLLEVRVGPPVQFVVEWLRVSGPWAFAIVNPQRPGGAQINTAGTTLEEAAEYMDGLRTYALLYHANGRWNVVDKAIGPTDAFWYGDPLYTRLPAGLMPD
ncbi:MAG: hypothetical protein CMN86_18950 [Stappia sp.]|nr:hypothetical protein [Stappia sp.]